MLKVAWPSTTLIFYKSLIQSGKKITLINKSFNTCYPTFLINNVGKHTIISSETVKILAIVLQYGKQMTYILTYFERTLSGITSSPILCLSLCFFLCFLLAFEREVSFLSPISLSSSVEISK